MTTTTQVSALATATVLLMASPAWADVRTFDGTDAHLYLNESKDKTGTASLIAG